MHNVAKGDELELKLLKFLSDQKARGELLCGGYPAELCRINPKGLYWHPNRGAYIEFDLVIEFKLKNSEEVHSYIVFECKNYKGKIPVGEAEKFSYSLSSVFKNNSKGIIVVQSGLQSGAEETAKKTGIAIAKLDESGLQFIIHRSSSILNKQEFIKRDFYSNNKDNKPLKFSSYYNDRFYGSMSDLLNALVPSLQSKPPLRDQNPATAPFISDTDIASAVNDLLLKGNYQAGEVDLTKICDQISVELSFQDEDQWDSHGNEILGHADFERRIILVNRHENKHRERFTIAHEIGHFCLEHDRYLRSEPVIKRDFFKEDENESKFDYDRLEIQANKFASHLLMPDTAFRMKVREIRKTLDMRNRGYGDVYVDDQPGNQQAYWELLNRLSTHFNVSKQAVELRLKNTIGVTDKRTRGGWSSISDEIKAPSGGKSN